MVSVEQIEKGMANYLDAELMPKLKSTGIERVMVGTAASLLIHKTGTIVTGYKDNKFVRMLGIIDKDGNVDVETLAKELKNNIPKEGFVVDVPVLGTLTFHEDDVDKLCDYVMV